MELQKSNTKAVLRINNIDRGIMVHGFKLYHRSLATKIVIQA